MIVEQRSHPLWLFSLPLVLASASAIRRDLLARAGIPLDICPAPIDERAEEAASMRASPEEAAAGLARAKALAVSRDLPRHLVLGADQMLALDGERFHKPRDRAEARRHIVSFSGRIHHLHSGLALARDGRILWSHVESAAMHVRRLTPAFIEAYLDAAGDAVTTSVGAYQFEALGMHLFERIEGDHSTILGLPMQPLLRELRREGALAA